MVIPVSYTGPDREQLETVLIDLAVDGWKMSRLFARVVNKLDAGESQRYVGQIRYYLKRLTETLAAADLTLVDLEGQPYDAGLAVTALNLDEFDTPVELAIEQMVEPVVMGPEGLRRLGVVTVRRVES